MYKGEPTDRHQSLAGIVFDYTKSSTSEKVFFWEPHTALSMGPVDSFPDITTIIEAITRSDVPFAILKELNASFFHWPPPDLSDLCEVGLVEALLGVLTATPDKDTAMMALQLLLPLSKLPLPPGSALFTESALRILLRFLNPLPFLAIQREVECAILSIQILSNLVDDGGVCASLLDLNFVAIADRKLADVRSSPEFDEICRLLYGFCQTVRQWIPQSMGHLAGWLPRFAAICRDGHGTGTLIDCLRIMASDGRFSRLFVEHGIPAILSRGLNVSNALSFFSFVNECSDGFPFPEFVGPDFIGRCDELMPKLDAKALAQLLIYLSRLIRTESAGIDAVFWLQRIAGMADTAAFPEKVEAVRALLGFSDVIVLSRNRELIWRVTQLLMQVVGELPHPLVIMALRTIAYDLQSPIFAQCLQEHMISLIDFCAGVEFSDTLTEMTVRAPDDVRAYAEAVLAIVSQT
jgi:hypothetical protein